MGRPRGAGAGRAGRADARPGALHAEAVGRFRRQIDVLSAQLLAEAPDQHARLFDPAVLQAETERRQAELAARRARQASIAAAPPPPPPAKLPARPVIASAILLAPLPDGPPVPTMPLLSMTPWATIPETPEPAAPADPPAPEVPPQWLVDLRRSPYRRGFYHSEEEFAALHVERERAHLFVSFDNLSQVARTRSTARPGDTNSRASPARSQLGTSRSAPTGSAIRRCSLSAPTATTGCSRAIRR